MAQCGPSGLQYSAKDPSGLSVQSPSIGSLITVDQLSILDPASKHGAESRHSFATLEAMSHCKSSKRNPVLGRVIYFSNRIPSKY